MPELVLDLSALAGRWPRMSDQTETLDAVVAEMREWSTDENDALARYADRIERAIRKHDAELVAYFAQAFVASIIKREEGGDHA